jgi:hypothetical protein
MNLKKYSQTHNKILWILEEGQTLSHKIILGTYGIYYPDVEWCDIDVENIDSLLNSDNFNVAKFSKSENNVEVYSKIVEFQPNIIIFGGTTEHLDVKSLESIGWDITYASKMYVNDEKIADTTSFYITSPDKLWIEPKNRANRDDFDKLFWHELKMAVKIWEEMR